MDENEITTAAGRFRVRIEYDDSAESPRQWSNLGVITLTAPGTGRLDIEEDTDRERIAAVEDAVSYERDARTITRYLRMAHGATAVLPIRRQSGGDLVEATRNDEYDGAIYDTPETRAECGEPADMMAALIAELNVYNKWARGEFVGFVVERSVPACEHGHGDEWQHVESVWGFDDESYALEQGCEIAQAQRVEDFTQQCRHCGDALTWQKPWTLDLTSAGGASHTIAGHWSSARDGESWCVAHLDDAGNQYPHEPAAWDGGGQADENEGDQ